MSSNTSLSERDRKFRSFAQTEPIWKVVLYVGFPLSVYQGLGQIFKILDSMMAAHISAQSVSAVAYLSQINLMLSAIGGGLAIGAGIKISEAYGAGNLDLVKSRVSTLFAMCAILGIGLLLILVPFAPQFLRLAKTPESFIAEGTQYFILELFGMVVSFFNNVYIAVERARGNSKRILWLNMIVFVLKLGLTAFFVYGMDSSINMIAVATILSQAAMLLAGIFYMNQKGNAFGFSLRAIRWNRDTVMPMIGLSIPVTAEKIAFSFGKVIINSMSTVYDSLTVGALGISNNIGGFSTSPQNGFQDGAASVISQNLGAGQTKRAIQAFRWVLLINVLIGGAIMSLSLLLLNQISALFAGEDPAFGQMISSIYRMEALGAVPLGVNAAVMALLYGFGKTKLSLLINFSRVFLFRIPVLWFLQNFTDLGSVSVGVVMGVSNLATGVLSMIVGLLVVYRIRNPHAQELTMTSCSAVH